jgi:flavodoxin
MYMKIGIIVYSQTYNTLGVAERLRDALANRGAEVEISRVTVEGDDPKSGTPLKLIGAPDPNGYDAVVFASPVQAFSLAQAMVLYLKQLPRFEAKKVLFFTTQYLKKPWLGTNHAIRQAKALIDVKGKSVSETGVVHWSSEQREEQIAALLES